MHKVWFLLLGIALIIPNLTAPAPVRAAMVSTEEALAEKSLGKKDAPITILAFESLTCPHCASFHSGAWPRIKKEYIDTGKARFVYSDFPLNDLAAVASMVARCTGKERYFGMIEMLFKTQETWARSKQPLKALGQIARMGGLSDKEFQACVRNDDLYRGIRARQREMHKKYKIESTPTFVINGKKIVGAQPFEEFDRLMKPMLK